MKALLVVTTLLTGGLTFAQNTNELNVVSRLVHPNCFGSNDGAIVLEVTGGTPPYSFQWNNGSAEPAIANLYGGTYKCEIEDANGLKVSFAEKLLRPKPLSIGIQVTHVTNEEANNGSISTHTNGGNAPYSYAWSNQAATNAVHDLTAGFYSVIVTDKVGCSLSIEAEIREEIIDVPETLPDAAISSSLTQ